MAKKDNALDGIFSTEATIYANRIHWVLGGWAVVVMGCGFLSIF